MSANSDANGCGRSTSSGSGSSSARSVYDFGGRQMRSSSGEAPTILTPGVTWRNGTIVLQPGGCLRVISAGVVLIGMHVKGGACGVNVQSGGAVTMTESGIHSCDVGISLQGSGGLTASDLTLVDCMTRGLELADSSTATVTDCRISGDTPLGIRMHHASSMTGTRDLGGLRHKARLVLTGCTVEGELSNGEESTIQVN
ncbi:MAG: hypothetical protein WDW38_010521 [Sanguina aurantia]